MIIQQEYNRLLALLEHNNLFPKTKQNIAQQGNLAYFTDCYCQRPEWSVRINAMEELINKEDLLAVSWAIQEAIYKEHIMELALGNLVPHPQVKDIKEIITGLYNVHREVECLFYQGALKDFVVVSYDYFPKWFTESNDKQHELLATQHTNQYEGDSCEELEVYDINDLFEEAGTKSGRKDYSTYHG